MAEPKARGRLIFQGARDLHVHADAHIVRVV
jgi:hypothetical protein